MRLGPVLRGAAAALVLLAGAAAAHPLPGSELTFAEEGAHLALTITMPVEDLVLAEPALAGLVDVPLDTALPEDQTRALARYMQAHMALMQGDGVVPQDLRDARITLTRNDHVGAYNQLVMAFALPIGAEAFPLGLRYDAVLHTVRSHRITVLWSAPGTVRTLARFGMAQAQPVMLPAP
ncbi:hypothetical protein [Falsirhodobacter algicola]|uniref:Uncharacterized protein n=1 Tax=Falsirhodobacter algicola TaxID=2692330 RepID=A0A8J8SLF2_9RHOB|nr:hypothetical protein [Falsirhodobacter algicola]QUS37015.1 hypothetical protein GR316_11520 [Falsirhodobacter algicola]